MCPDQVNLYQIWRETLNTLDRYDKRVQESKDLDAALAFSKFVFFSGIIKLCESFPQPPPLKVDGAFLRWKCEDLQSKINERYRLNDSRPHIELTQLEQLNRKLDLIAGHISKLPLPQSIVSDASSYAHPALRVIDGGVS